MEGNRQMSEGKREMMKCIGYGIYEGKCSNQAGTAWTPFWCKRCDELRKKTITKQLKEISASLSSQNEKTNSPSNRSLREGRQNKSKKVKMKDYGKTRFGSRILYVLSEEDAQATAEEVIGRKLTEDELHNVQKNVEDQFDHHWSYIVEEAIQEVVRKEQTNDSKD